MTNDLNNSFIEVQSQERWLTPSVRIPEYWDGKRINPIRERLYKPGCHPKDRASAITSGTVLKPPPFKVKAEYVPYLEANGLAFRVNSRCGIDLAPEGVSHWPQQGEGEPGEERKKRLVKLLNQGSSEELVGITGIGEQTVERIIAARPLADYEAVERLLTSKQITAIIKYIESCEERDG